MSEKALYYIQKSKIYEIQALLTIITSDYDRVSMHGFRTVLLERQAEELGYGLEKVLIPKICSNQDYENQMRVSLEKYKADGITKVIFGDIFLDEVRKYREKNLRKLDTIAVFPLWQSNTNILANEFIRLGFKAIITCVDSSMLDGVFVGREFDMDFLDDLPSNVDPCGENGEFHTFVYDGPIFNEKISVTKGDVVVRDERFYYCDLLLI